MEVVSRRGWDVLVLRSGQLVAEVLPGRGGDVLSLRAQPDDTELLALVSSANIACGWHAGDARLMQATIDAALAPSQVMPFFRSVNTLSRTTLPLATSPCSV